MRLPFSGLSPLVIDEVKDEGELIRVRARTPAGPVACPDCGTATARVHGYHERTVTDIALDARQVVLKVRVRRLVCPTYGCRRTFREQVPGVVERYQRRTSPADSPDRRGGQGTGRACRGPGPVRVGRARIASHRAAGADAVAAAGPAGAAGARCRFIPRPLLSRCGGRPWWTALGWWASCSW